MHYLHLPPECNWDPDCLVDALAAKDVEAVVDHQQLIIALPDAKPNSLLWEVAAHLLPKGPHQIVIEYSEERFVANVSISSPGLLDGVSEPLCSVEGALLEAGCKLLGYRDALELYCPDSSDLAALVDQYELLVAEKEELVAKQDFEAAVVKRDRQNQLTEQMDALFFIAIGRG